MRCGFPLIQAPHAAVKSVMIGMAFPAALPPRASAARRTRADLVSRRTLPISNLRAAAPTDRSLADLVADVAQRQDRQSFGVLFDHFAPRLKAYLARTGSDAATAEEVVQDVMLTLWRRAESFDPHQASVGTWVFTIARNRRIDLLRREQRPEIDPDDPALAPAGTPAAEELDMGEHGPDRLRRAT